MGAAISPQRLSMAAAVQHVDISSVARAEPCTPLFVLSVWRSGSSLLYALLNQHSKIALLYEGDLPRLHRFLFGRFRNGTWRDRWEFWNRGPSRHGIALQSMPENVADAWEATRIVYKEVARQKHATIWGEKTPHWFDCPLYMAEKFPDARFIFLWRDPNAVMDSIHRAALSDRFFRKAGFLQRVLVGTEKLKRACDTLKSRGRLVHELDYEDLTSDASQSMLQICQFLEIPFESQMASLEGADRSAISSGQHHAMVRGDRVVAERKRTIALLPAVQAKISRYTSRWKLHYQGWPKYPGGEPDGIAPPRLLELLSDRVIYHLVLCRDKIVAFVYALIPLNLARQFRAWVRQRSRTVGSLSTSE